MEKHWHTLNTLVPKIRYDQEDDYGISELLEIKTKSGIIQGYFCSDEEAFWFADENLAEIDDDYGVETEFRPVH